ncbi:DUF2804 domain-containing protein [Microbacterium sp. USHLN186]|uniref:DUF2804 domain-containing protein n=1 Tax=Microbacterium sp. USHLN186 TaxID=3081286 RepID=UPI003018FCE4
MTPEREITERVALTDGRGRQNPDAVGWAREPIIDTDDIGGGLRGWGRSKRWEHWTVLTPTHAVALMIGALDYANVRQLWVLDRRTGTEVDAFELSPLSVGVQLPGTLDHGPARSNGRQVSLEFSDAAGATLLVGRSPRVRVEIVAARRPGHEILTSAAPYADAQPSMSVRDVDRPASGVLEIDGIVHDVPAGASWAMLDHLRARPPYRTHWVRAAGAGMTSGHRLGLQLEGGPQALRHGVSQNAFAVDGRVHKIAGDLEWTVDHGDPTAPWRARGDRVDLTLHPEHVRRGTTRLLALRYERHQRIGRFQGQVRTDGGEWLDVDGVTGWVEEVVARW